MDATELHDLFRVEMRDTVTPYLFAGETIYSYIDAAQVEFCRRTEGIESARDFSVAITPGEEWYDIDQKILKLRHAYNKATGRPVDVVSIERAEQAGIRFDGRAGPLKALVSGAEKDALRAWPVPNEAADIQLEVFRLPQTVSEDSVRLEIASQHHRYLLDWAKYLALSIADPEVFGPEVAAGYYTKFSAYCARAKAEQGRARHSAGAVQYGGL